MKKRILSLVFAVVIIFGSICTPFLASADESTTDYLLDEMKTNMPDFDPAKYTANANGSPMIVGSTLYDSYHDVLDTWNGTTFSLYIFNPRQLDIRSALVEFYVTCWNDDVAVDPDFGDGALRFYRDDYSKDKLFYKLTIDLSSGLQNCNYFPGEYNLIAFVNSLELSYFSGSSTKTWVLNQAYKSTFEPQREGGYNVKTTSTALEQFDVNITSYKIGTVNTDLTRQYEVFTAYFAIPEDYIKYYENFYSATATYIKKLTRPIIWGNNPNYSVDDLVHNSPYFLSSDYSKTGGRLTEYGYGNSIYAHTGVNLFNASDSGRTYRNYFSSPFYWYFYDEEGGAGNVTLDELEYALENSLSEYRIFQDYQSITQTVTIDDTFDALSYYQTADFNDYWYDYGLEYALLYWAAEHPALFGFFVAGLGGALSASDASEYAKGIVDDAVEYKNYLEDEPNIFLFSDEERELLTTLSDEEISRRYLVDLTEVDKFKSYVSANPYTVLLRYDVCESYSDELVGITTTNEKSLHLNLLDEDGYSYGIAQKYMYFDFEIIDITFKLENEYFSVATKSEKKNYISAITVTPKPEVPSIDNAFSDAMDALRDSFSNGSFADHLGDVAGDIGTTLGKLGADLVKIFTEGSVGIFEGFGDRIFGTAWKVLKPILITLGVALVIFVLWWIVKSVSGSDFFELMFTGKNIGLKAKEVAIKSRDSDTRRKESEDNAALRRRELDIRATDQRNRKAEADADAKLRERDLARREREAEADAKLRGRDLDRREREAADNKEARRIDQEIKAQELITRSEKDDRDFILKKSADERSERYLKMREKAEKRTASDFRRKQKEIREKEKAEKKQNLKRKFQNIVIFLFTMLLKKTLPELMTKNLPKILFKKCARWMNVMREILPELQRKML